MYLDLTWLCLNQAPEVITSIETADISIAEIKRAIHRLKNGKSPGIDAISAEMLKCSENDAVKQLHSLFNSIWKDQCVPEDWKKSLIVKVPKKGDLSECDNYRGISLLSVPSKIFCSLIDWRVVWTRWLGRSRQGFDLEGELLIKSLLYGTSWSSARNGKHHCTSTLLTFQRHLTASLENDFGTSWGRMAYLTSS